MNADAIYYTTASYLVVCLLPCSPTWNYHASEVLPAVTRVACDAVPLRCSRFPFAGVILIPQPVDYPFYDRTPALHYRCTVNVLLFLHCYGIWQVLLPHHTCSAVNLIVVILLYTILFYSVRSMPSGITFLLIPFRWDLALHHHSCCGAHAAPPHTAYHPIPLDCCF